MIPAPEPTTLESALTLAFTIRGVLPGESFSRVRWTVKQATDRWNDGTFQGFLEDRWGSLYFTEADMLEIVRRYTIHQLER